MLLLTCVCSKFTGAMAEVGSMPFMMQGLRMVQQLDLSWRRRGASWSATMCSSEMSSWTILCQRYANNSTFPQQSTHASLRFRAKNMRC